MIGTRVLRKVGVIIIGIVTPSPHTHTVAILQSQNTVHEGKSEVRVYIDFRSYRIFNWLLLL